MNGSDARPCGAALAAARTRLSSSIGEAEAARERLDRQTHEPPPPPHWRAARESGRAGAPLYMLCDFRDGLSDAQQAGIEGALQAAGLLDAWVTPDGEVAGDGDDQSPAG